MMAELPSEARCVVIGGGIIGCSVAYHLAKLGWKDIVLLERKRLTSGTTWHAAGLIGQLRGSSTLTKLAKYSAALLPELEAETGLSTGYRQNGSLSLALSEERLEELKRQATMGRVWGVEATMVSPAEARAKHPLIDLEGVTGALWIPANGQADPANVAQALAKAARQRGVRIFENTKVTGIRHGGGGVTGVDTSAGPIRAEYIVNCAGLWAREVGRMAGVNVPLLAAEHFYVVTDASPDIPRNLPVLRVPDECAYVKEEAGKLLVGFFEPTGKPLPDHRIPDDAEFLSLPEDWEHLSRELELAAERLPILKRVGLRTFFNGPESFTPDGRWVLGEAPNLRNFFVAAGFNSIGIQTAGGAGMAIAEWMEAGEPTFDLTAYDIRRCQPFHGNAAYLADRIGEALGLHYADQFPYRSPVSARGVRTTPLHERLAARGACFTESAGWERAAWFLPDAARARGEKAEWRYGWGRQPWLAHVAEEHKAARSGVGLFDLSTFGKIRVEGRDAEAVLQLICANDVAVPPGRIVYTPWLNRNGGVEADVTVSRLSGDAFLVVTPTASVLRDLAWLKRHIPDGAHCVATDVTAGEACLGVMGPRSRELLTPLVNIPLDNAAFSFSSWREIEIGYAVARAHRISFVGELGWEIYVPVDMARHVFDTLAARGADVGLRLCGTQALNSCRLEKAYRDCGHDMASTDHVLEAGLGFAVKLDKARGRFGDFIGRDGVLRRKQAGLSRRLLQFLLADPRPLLYGNEAILRDGRVAGYLTSGAHGHHLGAAVGLGYVACSPDEGAGELLSSTYAIEVAGEQVAARASLEPLYDPKGARLRM
jgi:glycine cleavage system aminomethyltransferase T/glycine/D-amino acid oxidase-like deaminating enzyme